MSENGAGWRGAFFVPCPTALLKECGGGGGGEGIRITTWNGEHARGDVGVQVGAIFLRPLENIEDPLLVCATLVIVDHRIPGMLPSTLRPAPSEQDHNS